MSPQSRASSRPQRCEQGRLQQKSNAPATGRHEAVSCAKHQGGQGSRVEPRGTGSARSPSDSSWSAVTLGLAQTSRRAESTCLSAGNVLASRCTASSNICIMHNRCNEKESKTCVTRRRVFWFFLNGVTRCPVSPLCPLPLPFRPSPSLPLPPVPPPPEPDLPLPSFSHYAATPVRV
jgi:hypothetical protein